MFVIRGATRAQVLRFLALVLLSAETTSIVLHPRREESLTGMLEHGARAKRLREVSAVHLGNITSYTGFFTVDALSGSNMFFWYFPALSGNADAPLLIWLQGGPGGSSMFGLFHEIGPFTLSKDNGKVKLDRRTNSWNDRYSLLFIDNPVGAGFSYTSSSSGYPTTEEEVAKNLLSCLLQFYLVFPSSIKVPLYITGESYAGHYIPALGFAILQHNDMLVPESPARVPLAGIAIGDGWIDPVNMVPVYPQLLLEMGLVDTAASLKFEEMCSKIVTAIKSKYMELAFQQWDEMINGDLFPYGSLFFNFTGSYDYDNFLNTNPPQDFSLYSEFLDSKAVRDAIHVGDVPFGRNATDCEMSLKSDFMRSMVPELTALIAKTKVLIYSGNLDIIVGAPLTESFMSKLKFDGSTSFHASARRPYKLSSSSPDVAGYVRHWGNLTQVVVRGAGHILPHDQPVAALDMITRFVEAKGGWCSCDDSCSKKANDSEVCCPSGVCQERTRK